MKNNVSYYNQFSTKEDEKFLKIKIVLDQAFGPPEPTEYELLSAENCPGDIFYIFKAKILFYNICKRKQRERKNSKYINHHHTHTHTPHTHIFYFKTCFCFNP